MACSPLLQALTPQDFKNQFRTGFYYLPLWSSSAFYNKDEIVYYPVTRLFYICLSNGVTSIPTTILDWALYHQGNINNYVQDSQIINAFAEGCQVFNPALFGDDASQILGYLYVVAAYLVNDLNARGVIDIATYPANSRSVGNVSESFTIPKWAINDPIVGFLAKTSYGQKYLSMSWAKTRGNIVSVYGGTRA